MANQERNKARYEIDATSIDGTHSDIFVARLERDLRELRIREFLYKTGELLKEIKQGELVELNIQHDIHAHYRVSGRGVGIRVQAYPGMSNDESVHLMIDNMIDKRGQYDIPYENPSLLAMYLIEIKSSSMCRI